jgi:GntR family transcriptional repressor for pyruvate dehydrogenase complex
MTSKPPLTFQKMRRANTAATTDFVVAQISELIARGDLKPGDRLPPERDLAARIGISRPSLRAGLRSLIAMGILRARQGSGTYIAEGPPTLDSEPLRMLAALHGFTYANMFEARRVIEQSVASMAAERATPEQLTTMAEELAEMYASLGDPQQYLIHDIKFHRAIGAASGNPILATLVEMVSGVMYERRRNTIGRAHDFTESLEKHREIYRAIRARRPEKARLAMQEHLTLAERAYDTEVEKYGRSENSATSPQSTGRGPRIRNGGERADRGTNEKRRN